MDVAADRMPYSDDNPRRHSLERLESQNKETLANIFAEPAVAAEADLEKNDLAPKQPAFPGASAPSDFPDGGFEAWLVVLGAWCCLFCSFGWINCIGVFQQYYQTHQLAEYSSSTVAWIPSMEVFMMFMGGPAFGKIFDSYGPRYMLLGGSIAHVFGLMMASLSTQYYQFILAQGICSALGASAVFYSANSVLPTWFFKKRATAFGITASGSSLGGVIFPIMVTKLIPQIGFAWTMRTAAFTILGMLIIANLTVKSRLKPSPRPVALMDFITPLKEPTYALLAAGSFFFFFGTFIPFNFIIMQALEYGMSPDLATYLLPILNATRSVPSLLLAAIPNTPSIFGRILPGIFADRYGRFNTMISTCIFSAAMVLALWLPSRGNIPIIIFGALYGFSSGAFVSLLPSLVAQISDVRQIGVRNGTLFLIVSFAGLTGNPIAGALVARTGGAFTGLQVFCGLAMAVGSALYAGSRWVQVGWKMKVI